MEGCAAHMLCPSLLFWSFNPTRGNSLALVEGCKHELEISIPVEAFIDETGKATEKVRQKVHLKGFRAGKAPASMVSKLYSGQIRQEVLEALVPRYFEKRIQDEQLKVVGS